MPSGGEGGKGSTQVGKRVHSPQESKKLTALIPSKDYTWEIGVASTGTPLFAFTYLVGYPV